MKSQNKRSKIKINQYYEGKNHSMDKPIILFLANSFKMAKFGWTFIWPNGNPGS